MAHPPEKQAQLRKLYVYERQSLEAAASQLDIGLSTARRWKADAEADGDDWERARAAARLTGDSRELMVRMLLEDYVLLHQATQEALKGVVTEAPLKAAEGLSRLADAFTKVMAAVGKASPELSALALVSEFVAELTKFVQERHPRAAPALLEVIEPFGEYLAKRYG